METLPGNPLYPPGMTAADYPEGCEDFTAVCYFGSCRNAGELDCDACGAPVCKEHIERVYEGGVQTAEILCWACFNSREDEPRCQGCDNAPCTCVAGEYEPEDSRNAPPVGY